MKHIAVLKLSLTAILFSFFEYFLFYIKARYPRG